MYAVPVTTEPTFKPGLPQLLFEGDYYRVFTGARQYDVTYVGGEQFLMLENVPPDSEAKLIYVDNWTTELERLAPHP